MKVVWVLLFSVLSLSGFSADKKEDEPNGKLPPSQLLTQTDDCFVSVVQLPPPYIDMLSLKYRPPKNTPGPWHKSILYVNRKSGDIRTLAHEYVVDYGSRAQTVFVTTICAISIEREWLYILTGRGETGQRHPRYTLAQFELATGALISEARLGIEEPKFFEQPTTELSALIRRDGDDILVGDIRLKPEDLKNSSFRK